MSSSTSQQRFALLGATGNTGRLILKRLLQTTTPGLEINVYVRSRTKLEGFFPSISSDGRVTVFEGSLKYRSLIRNCLSGATVIICTVGENENIPGITVLQDCAGAIIDGLSALRDNAPMPWTPPRLLFLSSATWNPRFAADRPALVHWMIRNAFARPYGDLVQAQNMLLDEVPTKLLGLLLVQPNALVKEPASGCVLSTEFAYTAVSYEDLAEGFVQLATRLPEYAKITAIGVSSARAENALLYVPFVFWKVIRGLLFQFVPGFWQAEYAISRWFAGMGGGKSKMV